MRILQSKKFISAEMFNTEMTPKRIVNRYELELYEHGEGFSVVDGVKYEHGGCHLLFARPNDERFSIGCFECEFVHFSSSDDDFSEVPACTQLNRDEYTEILDQISEIRRSDYLNSSADNLKCCSIVYRILSQTFSQNKENEIDVEYERYMDCIIATKEYMEQNFGSKITLDKLASIAYLSKNFYRTTFCRIMEVSPQKYLRRVRVSRALELLKNSTLGYREIAQICGFENQAYMNYVIKNETGKTPSEYRSRNG